MNYYIVPIVGELPNHGSLAKAMKIDKKTMKSVLDCVKASNNKRLERELELMYANMEGKVDE